MAGMNITLTEGFAELMTELLKTEACNMSVELVKIEGNKATFRFHIFSAKDVSLAKSTEVTLHEGSRVGLANVQNLLHFDFVKNEEKRKK